MRTNKYKNKDKELNKPIKVFHIELWFKGFKEAVLTGLTGNKVSV